MPSKKSSWPKPSKEMGELLSLKVSRFDTERRIMFGAPCYFVHGNMFVGVFSDQVFARFSASDRARLNEDGLGKVFEPISGRQMVEYISLSRDLLEDPGPLDVWLERSYSYAASLKPKERKARSGPSRVIPY